ncbi:P-loop containing nucleoside triphosphate hydrolase protein [Pelagophyceae sp. CCMP2097]|nr:P-loop containing nucleoside triphosphate hydrolase protein [Pelagophyceae sp. CCMP2097]
MRFGRWLGGLALCVLCASARDGGNRTLRLYLVGESGAGKSTLGNSLLGRRAFETGGGFDAVTTRVECFKAVYGGFDLEVCDTPGFNDGTQTDGEIAAAIVGAMRAKPPHGVVYVHDARQTRLSRATRKALQHVLAPLTAVGAARVFPRMAFVLTRSTGVLDRRPWRGELHKLLCRKYLLCGGADALRIVFAGHRRPSDGLTLVRPRFAASMRAWLRALDEPLDVAAPPPRAEDAEDADACTRALAVCAGAAAKRETLAARPRAPGDCAASGRADGAGAGVCGVAAEAES